MDQNAVLSLRLQHTKVIASDDIKTCYIHYFCTYFLSVNTLINQHQFLMCHRFHILDRFKCYIINFHILSSYLS